VLRRSPQEVDPLSWFTRPLIPSAFALVNLVLGAASIGLVWGEIAHPGIDLLSVLICSFACYFVQLRMDSQRLAFRSRDGAVALGIGALGLAVSTWANLESAVFIQFWWAPVGVAIVIAALAPYSSILQVLAYGGAALLLSAAAGVIAFAGDRSPWGVTSTVVLSIVNVVIAITAATTFIRLIVSRTLRMLEASHPEQDVDRDRQEALARVDRQTVARLGARVAPFLERVADAGTVTQEDRALAGQLARELRSDLVERTAHNWLESLSEYGRIFVVDPERRAERFDTAQRTALRGLLTMVLRSPDMRSGSLFVEVRGRESGSTAVALSFDVNLTESSRSLQIAPFYIALQSTVTGLRWDRARGVVTFEVD
jgi:hypothetical protein